MTHQQSPHHRHANQTADRNHSRPVAADAAGQSARTVIRPTTPIATSESSVRRLPPSSGIRNGPSGDVGLATG